MRPMGLQHKWYAPQVTRQQLRVQTHLVTKIYHINNTFIRWLYWPPTYVASIGQVLPNWAAERWGFWLSDDRRVETGHHRIDCMKTGFWSNKIKHPISRNRQGHIPYRYGAYMVYSSRQQIQLGSSSQVVRFIR